MRIKSIVPESTVLHGMSAWENKTVLASVSPAEISQEKSPHKLLQLIPQFR